MTSKTRKKTSQKPLNKPLYTSVIHRKKFSVWNLWEKVKESADKVNGVPVLGLTRPGEGGWLIVIHSDDLRDFLSITEEVKEGIKHDK